MKKLKFYVLALCSAMSVVSCDAIERNKSALNELGKELAAIADDAQQPEADESMPTHTDYQYQMQASPAGTPEQILRRTGYVASYNKDTKLPNWVAWHLTADRTIGPAKTHQFLCGFSMETRDMVAHSAEKLRRKNLDMIVANNLKDPGAGFGVDTNLVTFLTPDGGVRQLPLMSKDAVAGAILDEILKRRG